MTCRRAVYFRSGTCYNVHMSYETATHKASELGLAAVETGDKAAYDLACWWWNVAMGILHYERKASGV